MWVHRATTRTQRAWMRGARALLWMGQKPYQHAEAPVANQNRLPHHHLRAADTDRDAAAAALGEHYATGRLTADEHDERLTAAWQARTYGDLAALFDDLPPPRWGTALSNGSPDAGTTRAVKATRSSHSSSPRHPFTMLYTTAVPFLPALIILSIVAIMIVKGPLPLLLVAGWWWWSAFCRPGSAGAGRGARPHTNKGGAQSYVRGEPYPRGEPWRTPSTPR